MTFCHKQLFNNSFKAPLNIKTMLRATVKFAMVSVFVLSKFLPAMEKMMRVRVTKDAGVVVIMPMMEVTQ